MASYHFLRDWTTLHITGGDRLDWLHNFCTNEVRSLQPGEGCEAFVTNVKGKIAGHCFVLATDDTIVALTTPGQAATLLAHFERYIISEDVQLSDVSHQTSWTLLAGDDSKMQLSHLILGHAQLPHRPWTHLETKTHAGEMQVVCAAPLTEGGWLLGGPQDDANRLLEWFDVESIAPLDERQFAALRIQARWPLYGVDLDATNLPQEANRTEQAICFTKGCYLGQETVARIDALGHVNQQLAVLRFDSRDPAPAGTELTSDGVVVGRVSTSGPSPDDQGPLALAMIRRQALQTGTRLQSAAGDATVL